jgi:thiol-disulfide isomerase/thioredoxin
MQPTSKLGTVFLALTLSGLAVVGAVAGDETEPVAFDLTLHRGKTVYLDFWASWCAPCRDSFSFMNAMSERYSDQGLEIVAVNLDADRDAAQSFLEAHPAAFTVIFDPEGRVAEQFEPPVMPTSLIFDTEGRLVARHTGFFEARSEDYEATLVAAIEGRLDPDAPALIVSGKRRRGLGVQPWQRDLLAQPDMQLICDPIDFAYDDHVYFSREGSAGGRGFGGGGCGCN